MMDIDAPERAGLADQSAVWPWFSAVSGAAAGEGPAAGEFRHAFQIGTRWFLVPAGLPGEVYPPLPCARLPYTQAWCLGLANFRGDLSPVFDLGALMGEHPAGPGRYFLLLGRRDASAALCIDQVTGVALTPDAPGEPGSPLPEPWPEPWPDPLPDPLSALACGTLRHDGTDYHELDLSDLLGLLAERASLLRHAGSVSR